MKPFLAFDVETSGKLPEYALQPWRVAQGKAWITTFATSWRNGEHIDSEAIVLADRDMGVSFARTQSAIEAVLDRAIEEGRIIVVWNGVFDIAWCIAYGLEAKVRKCLWLDGMLLWKHLDNTPTYQGNRHYNLDAANKEFEPLYASYKKDVDYHDDDPAVRRRLADPYNRKDTEATLLHVERFWPQLTEKQQRAAQIETSALWHVAKANLLGMPVVDDNAMQLDHTLREVGNKLAERLAPHNCTEKDIRSPAKLRKLFYERWELPVVKVNDPTTAELAKAHKEGREAKGLPSTDKEVIQELAVDYDKVLWVGQWREALNLRTKFVTGLRKSVIYNEEGDVTHPSAIIFGTYTSRMTYGSKQGRGKDERPTGFALHQMKRDKRFRKSIIAPPGHDIVEADAAGQEFRWMAELSQDPTMLHLCHGGDPHSYLASNIFNEDYEALRRLVELEDQTGAVERPASTRRQLGKVGNLSLQYRTSMKRLRIVARTQYGLRMTEEEAKNIWLTYRRSYPKVPIYWENQVAQAKAQGWVETLAGRRVKLEGDWDEFEWSMSSTAINYPIQGTGGEQKYLALMMVGDLCSRYNARFAWDLHDGIYFFVPKQYSMAFAVGLKKVLDNLPYKKAWGLVPSCPMPWDVKIGSSWGSLKNYEEYKEAA